MDCIACGFNKSLLMMMSSWPFSKHVLKRCNDRAERSNCEVDGASTCPSASRSVVPEILFSSAYFIAASI